MDEQKIPFWRDDRVLKILGQVLAVVVVLAVLGFLFGNLQTNFRRLGFSFGYGFLNTPASFGIGDTPIGYSPTDPYRRALLVGVLNTLRVTVLGTILATLLGIVVGIARLSDNWLVRQLSSAYVEILRNTPLLLQLFFWYFSLFLRFPPVENRISIPGSIYLTQRGMDIPFPEATAQSGLALAFLVVSAIAAVILWRRRIQVMVQQGSPGRGLRNALLAIGVASLFALLFGLQWEFPQVEGNAISGGLNLSPEFGALLFGLVFYTAAYIAEVVRAGIQSVSKGQWEAARALGLKPGSVMQLVIFPQALRVMIPPLTSEFLNLMKNSSLAIAIGYADVYGIANTVSNQSGRAVEMLLVIMGTYLTLDLIISLIMNWFNGRVQLKER